MYNYVLNKKNSTNTSNKQMSIIKFNNKNKNKLLITYY